MSYYLPSAWKFIPLSIVQNYFQYDSVIKFDDNQLWLLQFMKMGGSVHNWTTNDVGTP